MTKTYFISDNNLWTLINSDFEVKGGVYKLFSTLDNKPFQIERVLKPDPKGILYIGKAQSFLDRVINLKKSISSDHVSENHDCGKRYKAHDSLKTKFPYNTLTIELTFSENPLLAEQTELKEYLNEFGELPPLNRV